MAADESNILYDLNLFIPSETVIVVILQHNT